MGKKGFAYRVVFVLMIISILILSSAASYSQVYQSKCPLVAYEGETVSLRPQGYDPDKDIGPAGHLIWEFGPPFGSDGKWQTFKGQRGIFDFWVSLSDGELKDTKHSCVEILPNNRAPFLYPVDDVYLTRGDTTKISATCVDPDGDPVSFSYRFNGKDVAYIVYEPPGVYNLEVICEDGFGGIAQQNAKLHVLMPEVPKPAPKPKVVPIVYVAPVPKPSTVEVVLPKSVKPEVVDVSYPPNCSCPAKEDVEVVIYDRFYPVESLANNTRTFVIYEPKKSPVQNTTKVKCGCPRK